MIMLKALVSGWSTHNYRVSWDRVSRLQTEAVAQRFADKYQAPRCCLPLMESGRW